MTSIISKHYCSTDELICAGHEPKEKDNSTVMIPEQSDDQEKENNYLHDKRYEEPFEDEGAYDDDFTDE